MWRLFKVSLVTISVMTAILSVTVAGPHASQPTSAASIVASLHTLPRTQPLFDASHHEALWVFRGAPYVSAAIRLQALGKERACHALLQLAAWEDRQPYGWDNNGYRSIVLCRMLFVPRDNQPFRRARIGPSSFLAGTSYSDWPLEPVALIDQLPFLIITHTGGADFAEPSVSYVQYCIENCDWTSTQFHLPSEQQKEQALRRLLALPLWKGKLSAADKEFLAQQITPSYSTYQGPFD